MNDPLMNNLKFAQFLADKGLLSPIVSSYKEWREQQNFPFIQKDKRLFKVAIMKALLQMPDIIASYHTESAKRPICFADYIGEVADAMVDNLYGEKKESANKEIQELMAKYKIKPEYADKVAEMQKVLSQDAFVVWLENAAKGFEERNVVESNSPKQVKTIQNAKTDRQTKEQLEIEKEIGTEQDIPKKIVKKRIIRKKRS